MKIISIIKRRGKVVREVTETDGDQSLLFFPQETPPVYLDGEELTVKLSQIEFRHPSQTVAFTWVVQESGG